MVRKLKLGKKDYEKTVCKDFIRKSLNVIILILLKQKPASGFELIQQINEKFGLLFGPSTIYPLLHSLGDYGLLITLKSGKSIRYKIRNSQKVHKILYHHFKLRKTLEKMMRRK